MGIKIKLLTMSCILGTNFLISTSVFAKNSININRLAGQDRYGTSNAIVSQGWTQSDYAVLVNSQNFPDAITASPLAKKYNAPILLTDASSLTDTTKQKLQDLGVKNMFIIGGVGVVNSGIENTLESMGISVKRIWGQDRYETSVNVAKELSTSKGVFVVNGEHYEDALLVAPIAAKLQYPIILVGQNNVPDTVKNYVNNQVKTNDGEVDVIGGKDVLTDNITSTLNPTKVYNQSTKYDRNLALIDNYRGQLDLSTVYIASDKGFADALSGSALAGKNENPIILVGDSNQSNINSFISNNNVSNVKVLGGTGVLSDNTVDNIVNGSTNTVVAPTRVTVKAVSSSEIQIQWNPVQDADYYYVYYSNDNINYTYFKNTDGSKRKQIWSNSDHSASLSKIPSNLTIYFKITAVKNGVESEVSNIVSATTLGSTTIFFPQLSDVPMPTNANYYTSSILPSTGDGTKIIYYYSASSLSSNFISDYESLLKNNGWVFFESDISDGKPYVIYVKGKYLTLIGADDAGNIMIMGTIH